MNHLELGEYLGWWTLWDEWEGEEAMIINLSLSDRQIGTIRRILMEAENTAFNNGSRWAGVNPCWERLETRRAGELRKIRLMIEEQRKR